MYLFKEKEKKKNTLCLCCIVDSVYLCPDDLMTLKEKGFLTFLHWHVLINVHYCLQTRLCYNFTLGPLENINQICNCFSLRDCSSTTLLHDTLYWIDCKKSKKAEDFSLFISSEDMKKFFYIFCRFFSIQHWSKASPNGMQDISLHSCA